HDDGRSPRGQVEIDPVDGRLVHLTPGPEGGHALAVGEVPGGPVGGCGTQHLVEVLGLAGVPLADHARLGGGRLVVLLGGGPAGLDDGGRPGVHVTEVHHQVVARPVRTGGHAAAQIAPRDVHGEVL